jgi:hypothetical protein
MPLRAPDRHGQAPAFGTYGEEALDRSEREGCLLGPVFPVELCCLFK